MPLHLNCSKTIKNILRAICLLSLVACPAKQEGPAVTTIANGVPAASVETTPPPEAGVEYRAPGTKGGPMLVVPAGEFIMGCDENKKVYCDTNNLPLRKVYLDEYLIDKFEVTTTQFQECVRAGKCENDDADNKYMATTMNCNWAIEGRDDQPVNCVNWIQADAYCSWAGKRLPTEAEWEKAARGTDGRIYPWGDEKASCEYAVFDLYDLEADDGGPFKFGCGKHFPWPVGSKPKGASPYGAMDMAGNVNEWVADLYGAKYYAVAPQRNPKGPVWGQSRINRGGSYNGNEQELRSWNRRQGATLYGSASDGFRCAKGTSPTPPSATVIPEPRKTPIVPGEMVVVAAGDFIMGASEDQLIDVANKCELNGEDRCNGINYSETPQHKVTLDEFQIDKYEVTIGRYMACVNAGKCLKPDDSNNCSWGQYLPDNENYPVSCVNWDMANAFCEWDGKRLPTEAEWEKAARGVDGQMYPWGDEMATCDRAVMYDNGDYGCARESRIWPVGSKPRGASPYGAMDMSGNLMEWVNDWYDPNYYADSPTINPEGPISGEERIFKGGDWSDSPSDQRVVRRAGAFPKDSYSSLGFRCAKGRRLTNPKSPERRHPTVELPPGVVPGETILIPAGKFTMGNDQGAEDEIPAHEIYLDAFKIDKYEVTVKEYASCMQAGKCSSPEQDQYCNLGIPGRDNHPINCVGWAQADAYCKWAGKRLPTEAEWEKAAKGTLQIKYPWGNDDPTCDLAAMAFHSHGGCGEDTTWTIGSFPGGASPYGVMDMSGNVLEWVYDFYNDSYYQKSPAKNPKGPSTGGWRSLRGGSWLDDDGDLRTSRRTGGAIDPTGGSPAYGFRCAKTP